MSRPKRGLKRQLKRFAEKSLGVKISRVARHPGNKHADAALRTIRTWSRQDVVFDVGANDGRTILRLHNPLNAPQFYAFEPVSSTYETLVRRTAHLDNVHCVQSALGAESGEARMYLSEIDAMNSFSEDWADPVGSEVVPVDTVDGFMDAHGIDFVHFLKVDVEGHDLEVLKGARHALESGRIALVQVEVGVDQLAKNQPSLESIRQYLAPLDYYLYGIYNQCRAKAEVSPSWPDNAAAGFRPAVLAYCDALFVHVVK